MSGYSSVLRRFGLERPDVRAWAVYDWANSAFMTSVVAAIFPVYFATVVAEELPAAVATRRFALATAGTLAAVALVAPLLGAVADRAGYRKRFLGAFLLLGSGATASLATVGRGDWILGIVLFALANIGAYGSLVFYDSLLPHLARREELDRVSAAGYGVGYLGGGLLLAVHLLWLRYPQAFGLPDIEFAARLAFVTVALWWLAFSVPLFRRVAEPTEGQGQRPRGRMALRAGLQGLMTTFREVRRHRDALWFLVAFLLYSDGIGTIMRLAAAYGSELGISVQALVAAILLVQIVAAPCTILFGRLAGRIGTKPALLTSLAVYALICVLAFGMSSAAHFFGLAILVGTVQGGAQAIGRSLFASLIPRAQSAEFFSFFAVTDRFAGFLGPTLFALVGAVTGSNRYAILALVALFVGGAAILARVDVEEARRAASGRD